MTRLQIKKLARELGMDMGCDEDNDLTWGGADDGWCVWIDCEVGKSFQCQSHSIPFFLRDPDKEKTKTQVWDEVAMRMRFEADTVTSCDCGYWEVA
tara:strand:- start:646 stop:933 length:288 start_codon:yes stop_codon:yes gene_type:complete